MNKPMLSSLAVLGALALASAGAQAQVVNGNFQNGLASWSTYGDVVAQGGTMTLTTAYIDTEDLPFNLSGHAAVDIGMVEAAAGVAPYALDLSATEYGFEGSLSTQSFNVAAGQTLSFSWSFSTHETQFEDHAFVVIDGQAFTLATRSSAVAGQQSFSHVFSSAGTANLAFGVIDTVDGLGVSSLAVSNVQLTTAVPEPTPAAMLLAGLGVMGLLARRRRG